MYKKKTRSSVQRNMNSYKTWDNIFFSNIRAAMFTKKPSPFLKVARAVTKNKSVADAKEQKIGDPDKLKKKYSKGVTYRRVR